MSSAARFSGSLDSTVTKSRLATSPALSVLAWSVARVRSRLVTIPQAPPSPPTSETTTE